jgi:hypothetical protein
MILPMVSTGPPAAKGTIMVTGRVGQAGAAGWAPRCRLLATAATSSAAAIKIFDMQSSSNLPTLA